jgi:hypothetical protein
MANESSSYKEFYDKVAPTVKLDGETDWLLKNKFRQNK